MPRLLPISWPAAAWAASQRRGSALLRRGWRWLRLLLALLLLLLALAALAWQYYLVPRLDQYRPTVAGMLAQVTGNRAEVARLVGGWRGPRPHLQIQGVTLYGDDGKAALRVSRLDAALSWWSLLVGELRFHRMALQVPDLTVRRDRAGVWHVAGLRLDPKAATGDTRFADWLLAQHSLSIRGGQLRLVDESRSAPPHMLRDVTLAVQRRFGAHRFTLSFTPPRVLADPVRIEGHWRGDTLQHWRQWQGEVRVALPRLALEVLQADWLRHLERLPGLQGRVGGNLRLAFEEERISDVTATLRVAGLSLAGSGRSFSLPRFDGTLDWRRGEHDETFKLAAARIDGANGALCRDCRVDYTRRADGSVALAVSRVQLAGLAAYRAWLPQPWQARIRPLRLAGQVREAQLHWLPSLQRYRGEVVLEEAALSWGETLPRLGRADLTARFDQDGGSLVARSSALAVAVPRLFAETLQFGRFELGGRWQRDGQAWNVMLDRLQLGNTDLELTADARYRHPRSGLGTLALSGRIARLSAARVHAYLPLAAGAPTRAWLANALREGEAYAGRIEVSGPLAQFPFAGDRGGRFRFHTKVRDVRMAYAPGWPELTGIDGELDFRGQQMDIRARQARILSAEVGQTRVWVPNLASPTPHLLVDGRTESATADFLAFLRQSPLRGTTAAYIDGLKAQGRGSLTLKLDIPLHDAAHTRVGGEYRFDGNTLDFGGAVPLLQAAAGRLTFSEQGLALQDGQAQVLGGTSRFAGATSPPGEFLLQLNGQARLRDAATRYGLPEPERLAGLVDYQVRLTTQRGGYHFTLESPLAAARINLPAPLGKAPGEIRPFRLEIADRGDGIRYGFGYGKLLQGAASQVPGRPSSGVLALGEQPPRLTGAPGWALTGGWDTIDLDGWLALLEAPGRQGDGLGAVQLGFDRVRVEGLQLRDVRLTAQRSADSWRGSVDSREASGQFSWRDGADPLLALQLARLALPLPDAGTGAVGRPVAGTHSAGNADWPAIKLAVDAFSLHGRELGRLALTAVPQGESWRFNDVVLGNDEAELKMNGVWRRQQGRSRVSARFALKSGDFGKLLGRVGYPDTLRRAAGTFSGEVAWDGVPHRPDFDSMQGSLALALGAGQFARIDPGAARLLSILSLQSLTRRVKLDFRDVFSEGFEFDSIEGAAIVERGIARTDDLVIAGPAAQVLFRGEANFVAGTQDLRVRIVPVVGDTVAVAAGLVNPLAGLAAFLLQRALKDPLGQFVAYEYQISGAMRDPVVRRLIGNEQARLDQLQQRR
ncbi:YhdP family protein [Chitiniphilus purpureus]|uniref:YhdP family protein n=1 Tax=Chitiniphilus purpureus TaxID=2981137 RepID=A0ABY6DLC1_9NEIS|nr:YhdP family protein [Chitiniphilus sp. CD1]UXY14837.1 YhdP family protein [Chitiniphilus sp. CD1]